MERAEFGVDDKKRKNEHEKTFRNVTPQYSGTILITLLAKNEPAMFGLPQELLVTSTMTKPLIAKKMSTPLSPAKNSW
ncbi:hypothetical protein XI09_10130 [Bradyrhizobium sp. CCBAU 11386]|nr:hypothetical protein [Bradyrhizobium sp. CCBAU 11386]